MPGMRSVILSAVWVLTWKIGMHKEKLFIVIGKKLCWFGKSCTGWLRQTYRLSYVWKNQTAFQHSPSSERTASCVTENRENLQGNALAFDVSAVCLRPCSTAADDP